jgi:hypothetical protein
MSIRYIRVTKTNGFCHGGQCPMFDVSVDQLRTDIEKYLDQVRIIPNITIDYLSIPSTPLRLIIDEDNWAMFDTLLDNISISEIMDWVNTCLHKRGFDHRSDL